MKKIICLIMCFLVAFASVSVRAFDDGCICIGIENDVLYTADELTNVEITSYDGCDLIEIWIDYKKFSTLNASGYVDLSSLNIGRHKMEVKVYDSGELISQAQIRFCVVTKSKDILWQTDMSGYSSTDSTFPSGIGGSFGSARGTAVILSDSNESRFGSEHGTVVLVNATRTDGNPENGAYFQFNYSCTSAFCIEFDTFISSVPKNYLFQLRYVDGGAKMLSLSTVTDTDICGINKSNRATYEKNCWYHFKFDIDLNNSLSELTITKENESEPIFTSGKENLGIKTDKVNFRFNMAVSAEGQTADIAFDNFSIWKSLDSPIITKIGTLDNDDCIIQPEMNDVYVTLNRVLNGDTVNKNNIKVYNETENREASISDIIYDNNKIKISFEEDLISSSLYRIELSKNVIDESDANLISDLNDWFETDTSYLDVSDLKIITNGNKKRVKGTVTDKYGSGDAVLLVLSSWSGDAMIDIKYKNALCGDFEMDDVVCEDGNVIQFVVIDFNNNRTLIKY